MSQKKPAPSNATRKRTRSNASASAAKSSAKAKGNGAAKATSVHKSAAAPKPPAPLPARSSHPSRPTVADLHAMPTENIWDHYRKAVTQKPRDEVWIEQMRNVLMEMHYPLVKHIAERLLQTLPKSIELDDLVSAGLFGLMDAIRGFDPARGIKFKTYCTTRIRGSILDQLRSQDWVPRLVRLKAGKIEKALQKLQGEYGREPTHAELAATLRMDHVELSKEITNSRAKTMFSLQERWDDRDDDSGLEKVEIVEDRTAVDPIGEINRRDLMTYITRSLTHKERFIIEQYYQVGHTMREIGEMLALTESRVCQIHSNVMARLKGLLPPNSSDVHV
jgi:RNA polymerase sigma factor for flagellar operon FliA